METSFYDGLLERYKNIMRFISSNRGEVEADVQKETLINFFKYLYEHSDSFLSSFHSEDKIASLILDFLFYSLLCDFRDEINDLCTDMYNNFSSDSDIDLLLRGVDDPLEKQFIMEGIYLLVVSTSIYYDLEAPKRLREHLDDLTTHFNVEKRKLISILQIVAKYLKIYSICSSREITEKEFLEFRKFERAENPYIMAGYINASIKYMESINKISPLGFQFESLFSTVDQYNYEKFNEGYYYLLYARYKLIDRKYQDALKYVRYSLWSTNKYCPRNGSRRKDIIELRQKIIRQINVAKELRNLEKTKSRFNELKSEIYRLVGIILPVIVIPISVLIAFLQVSKNNHDLGLVLILLAGVIVSVLLTALFVISVPYIFRIIDNTWAIEMEKHLKDKRGGRYTRGEI